MPKARTKPRIRDYAEVIRAKLAADPVLAEAVEREAFNADIGAKVLHLREEAELTQAQLAEQIGTKQSAISRLEDANYEGHSLRMLLKIATVLGKRIRLEFSDPPAAVPENNTRTYTSEWRITAKWLSPISKPVKSGT